MKDFKERWEIDKNWQLLYPLIAIAALIYSGVKIALLFGITSTAISYIIGLIIASIFLILSVKIITLLEGKWKVGQRWELIRIFIVFAITGSSSVFVSKPIIKLIGISKENLNIILYYILFIFVSLVVYQILLITFGWLFGQFTFFWEFEKKILRRFGIKKYVNWRFIDLPRYSQGWPLS